MFGAITAVAMMRTANRASVQRKRIEAEKEIDSLRLRNTLELEPPEASPAPPAAYGDRVALAHSGGVTTTHRQITSEMTLEEASQAYSDFVKRPLTALPGPEVVDAEYKDVTPKSKDAAA